METKRTKERLGGGGNRRPGRKAFPTALLLALLLCLAACSPSGPDPAPSGGAAENNSQPAAAPTEAPPAQVGAFQVETLDGRQVDQTVFSEAKLTMVNLWATWCGPCLGELPGLGELAEELAGTDVQIIGIVYDAYDMWSGEMDEELLEAARTIVERTNVGFPVLIPDEALINGFLKDVQGFPTTWFVDAQGNIVGDPVLGAGSKEEWKDILQERLAEVDG